ncbi:DUF4252 domain-containing protein [Flavobacterium amnicola]|uniref:DUF4252 domain-containing protein n=1 Tax=Flavobacterium amnicola TaxID=2506422 RepID=A0A4Q1K3T3_9FLAO|nr:DUF4252 domain-containing protein [Flavobacterium amnicola]RXR17703.1 DUF4252 domain-containing protein [Flavobacterium amnicola]
MKKLVIITAVFLVSFLGNAQTTLDKFDGQSTVSSVVVNKKMFELMSKVKMESKEDQAYLSLIKKLENLKVYKTSSAKTTSDMRATVDKYLTTAGLEELMRVNESGKNAKIYVKSTSGSTQVKELLMFIEGTGVKGSETVLMSLTGDFDINEISLLTKRMNLPGGEVLNSAAKK